MKTISIGDFETLVARDDWKRLQDHDIVERFDHELDEWDEENESHQRIYIPAAWGWACKKSTLGDITISYSETFGYNEFDVESLSTSTEGQEETWAIEGVFVVDEDGDELGAHELADYLDAEFSSIDYSVLNIEQTTDIDIDEDSDMETITLEIDNAPNIRFTGELLASTASSANQASGSNYSGATGRWTELALYKTQAGKFICHQVGRTQWEGERDRFSGQICDSLEDIKSFFGHRWLAKDLYAEAGIDDAVEIA